MWVPFSFFFPKGFLSPPCSVPSPPLVDAPPSPKDCVSSRSHHFPSCLPVPLDHQSCLVFVHFNSVLVQVQVFFSTSVPFLAHIPCHLCSSIIFIGDAVTAAPSSFAFVVQSLVPALLKAFPPSLSLPPLVPCEILLPLLALALCLPSLIRSIFLRVSFLLCLLLFFFIFLFICWCPSHTFR